MQTLVVVSVDAILVAESDVKPLGCHGSDPNPAAGAYSTPHNPSLMGSGRTAPQKLTPALALTY